MAAESILLMAKPMKGITAVVNPEKAYGGFEEESEESLRRRIVKLERIFDVYECFDQAVFSENAVKIRISKIGADFVCC